MPRQADRSSRDKSVGDGREWIRWLWGRCSIVRASSFRSHAIAAWPSRAKGLSFISLMTYDGNMARTTDQTLAREALDALRNCKSVKLSVRGGRTVQVPDSAIDSFLATLEAVADGSTVEVVRTEAEVSTQQAARILNVSRPTAVRLFDTGEIISHKVGSHRRAKLKDVVEYRDAEAQRRRAALDEMVRDAEDSGLYDVEPLPFRR